MPSHHFAVGAGLVGDDHLDQLVVGGRVDGSADLLLLGIDEPAVVQRDVEQIEDDALGRVLEPGYPGEVDVDIET